MRRLLALSLATGCLDQGAIKVPQPTSDTAPKVCTVGEVLHEVRGEVTWVAIKNGTAPVVGTQSATGWLRSKRGKPLAEGVDLVVRFAARPYTGIDQRDQNVSNYMLAAREPTLEAHAVTGVAGTQGGGLPARGETADVTLDAQLSVGDQQVQLSVPALVTNSEDGRLRVQAGMVVDMRNQLGLGGPLDELANLVGVTIDDALTVRLTADLNTMCDGDTE